MKSTLLSTFLLMHLFCHAFNDKDAQANYSVAIWDYNYSMAYTIYFYIDGDSLTVKKISGVEGEKDSLLIKRKLSVSEYTMLANYFSSVDIYSLKSKYINPLIDDGDRKRIVVRRSGRIKTIEVANFYQKDLGKLFNVINQMLSKEMQIVYKKQN